MKPIINELYEEGEHVVKTKFMLRRSNSLKSFHENCYKWISLLFLAVNKRNYKRVFNWKWMIFRIQFLGIPFLEKIGTIWQPPPWNTSSQNHKIFCSNRNSRKFFSNTIYWWKCKIINFSFIVATKKAFDFFSAKESFPSCFNSLRVIWFDLKF